MVKSKLEQLDHIIKATLFGQQTFNNIVFYVITEGQ